VVSTPCVPELTQEVSRLGSTAARLKLKGIDGDPHKQRSVWFNSTKREEPYLGLTYTGNSQRWEPPKGSVYRCCMAVVSSCREMLG
jgi:hypothetical protein